MTSHHPIPSQTSSHAPLEPASGTTLLQAELNRRDTLRPPCPTGCRELDDATLLSGGFERGCVVGISAEEDDVALVLGLQTIAKLLLTGAGAVKKPRAMIVTMMGVGSLVGVLREVLRAQGGKETETDVLGRVAVSRVFDVNGLWEVLGEVDALGSSQEVGEGLRAPDAGHGGEENLRDRGEDGLRLVASPAGGHGPGYGGESVAAAHTEAHHLGEYGMEDGDALYAGEPSSSPLSDPPSSLPDLAPWESVQMAKVEMKAEHTHMADQEDMDWPRKKPPGQREEIQDSEAEEGFSSPLTPLQDSREASPAKLPEPQDSLRTGREGLESGKDDTTSPLIESPDGQSDRGPASVPPAEADEIRQLKQENLPSRPVELNNAQDDSSILQQKTKISKPADNEQPLPDTSSHKGEPAHPDIILITHMSTLLSSLFHQREKATAHQTIQLLASHLRYLARSTEYGGPLIMILNSTTSSESNVAAPPHDQDRDGPPRPPPPGGPSTPTKPLDPTLRSIFNPPPLPVSGLPYNYDTPHSRRNKPSFGLIFTQLLDMHLLCTRIPRTRADAEAMYAPSSPGTGKTIKYVWAVEVLLDEIGVWEGREHVLEGRPRRFRDQRWGAVEVRRDVMGVRIIDAFEKTAQAVLPQRIVLAAGFGGPRV